MSRLGDTRVNGISPRRVVIVGALIGAAMLYLLGGLAVRQIFKRDDYLQQYDRQSSRYVTVPAARGDILDRHGNVLVSSRPRYSVVIDLGSLREEFSVEARRDIRAARREQKKFSGMKIDTARLRASAVTKVVQRHLDRVNRVLGRSRTLDPAEVSRHLNEARALPFTLAKKLTPEEKARFLEAFPTDAPEQLFVETERTYPHGKLAAHLIGRLVSDDGEIREDLPETGTGVRVTPREGKQGSFGIERSFDETIRGRDGYQLWQVDNLGYRHKKLDDRTPDKGAAFVSSVDLELQKTAEEALDMRSRAGAAIVLDVQTGEILALASAPAFDPNEGIDGFSREYYKILEENRMLWNRALIGRYPPGSTFKLITAVAAMRSKTFNDSETIAKIAPHSAAANRPSGPISPTEKFDCGAFLTVNRQRKPEHDLVAFGPVDLARMIRVSSNVYCYNAALILGIEPIASEAFRFGFGEHVNMELREAKSDVLGRLVVANPKYKLDDGRGRWVAGDTTNAAIGQGFHLTSPMHIACMTASLARKETRTRPSVVHDPARARSRVDHGGEPLDIPDAAYAEILRGMTECVAAGTGKKAQVPGLDIAGKSGSAQWDPRKKTTLAWFTAFAPAHDPKVAVTVVLEGLPGENIGGGSASGPVVGAILKRWKELYYKAPEKTVPAEPPFEANFPIFDEYLPDD
ncbi:MAG: hypothetical protein IJW12_02505 [Opitutales bacterium]|nr:hypothetical protein [Opitutales bacterium]